MPPYFFPLHLSPIKRLVLVYLPLYQVPENSSPIAGEVARLTQQSTMDGHRPTRPRSVSLGAYSGHKGRETGTRASQQQGELSSLQARAMAQRAFRCRGEVVSLKGRRSDVTYLVLRLPAIETTKTASNMPGGYLFHRRSK